MDEKVFDRIEKKFLITTKEKRELLKLIRRNMEPDNYHKSEVFNLYFDNDNYEMIAQSIDWVDFKEKVRARAYGGYDRVFLEIKTKLYGEDDENIGYKRRVMITHDDFEELIKKKCTVEKLARKVLETTNDIQIAKELDYLIKHFDLKPKILIEYKRESYRDECGLRVTFDEKLKYRTKNLSLVERKRDKIYFKDKKNIIMEIKTHSVIPLWLAGKLSELKIYPQQFSKIGKIYEKIRKEKNV